MGAPKIKFVTSIYSYLHGTGFGGRERYNHYRLSLLALLNMKTADFVCYCPKEELQDLQDFFYNKHSIPESRLEFKVYDLTHVHDFKKIREIKEKQGFEIARCNELQYSKLIWLHQEAMIQDEYEYIYWIDSGLSHCALFPLRYLGENWQDIDGLAQFYHYTKMFNDLLVKNIIKHSSKNKILGIGYTGIAPRASLEFTPSMKTRPTCKIGGSYTHTKNDLYMIGGLFGGSKSSTIELARRFRLRQKETLNRNFLYSEEVILTSLKDNDPDFFDLLWFDCWWHEDDISMINNLPKGFIQNRKSFYEIFEF